MVNHSEVLVIFQDIKQQLRKNIGFYEVFIKLRRIFYLLKIIYWKLCKIAQPHKIFTSQY